ncbi:MAG: hypothetical protein IJT23_01950 [Clostridia bacterium]|nr:hypothetical protein [Clostridia bacterium]
MALIKCFECGKEVSDEAVNCPHCGYNMRKGMRNLEQMNMYQRIYDNIELPTPPKAPSQIGVGIGLCVLLISAIAFLCAFLVPESSGIIIAIISMLVMCVTAVILVSNHMEFKQETKEYKLSLRAPELYKMYIADKEIKDTKFFNGKESSEYIFHYFASFIIPIVGFVLGAMLLSNDDDDIRDKGKNCIWLGVASVALTVILVTVNILHN